jgi:predicted ATPase/class 3 adenylate cyclase
MDDVTRWLERNGLGKYAQVFAENEIEFEVLGRLNDDDLREMGLPVGPRKKFQAAIEALAQPDRSGEATPPSLEPARAGDAERRQLTIMFCDLVGSTALSDGMDPEDFREVVTAFQAVATRAIETHQGYVARYMGDGLLAYFGYPVAHEDDAELAARAALALVEDLGQGPLAGTVDAAVRIGIATGMVVVGDLIGEGTSEERAVLGDTPNLAARLQGAATPNTVLLSEATRGLVDGRFELEECSPMALKGFRGPVLAWRLLGEAVADSRFEARHRGQIGELIGRDHELALLEERWRQAAGGEGQMISLTGEAGIGKSRLTRALIDSVAGEPHIRIIYQCSPYQSDSAFYPVTHHLSRAAEFAAGDSLDTKLDKLEALLLKGTDDVVATAPLIASLLGLDASSRYGALNMTPQQQRRRTLKALSDQIPGLSTRMPLLLVVEDVHWIDPTTLELVDLILNKIANARVLLVATARPTFQNPYGGHPIVTHLALNRFGRSQTASMVNRLTPGGALPTELFEEIVKRTDGVPLFVEELTKSVLESDLLRRTDRGYVLEGSLSTVAIPTSLHDSLMARLDRLQPVKEVAQTAACIGRDFDYQMLSAVSPLTSAELGDALAHLADAELVFCRGTLPDATFTFKHALVRDAAYDSLLRSTREQIHARIFAAMDEAQSHPPELVAYHANQAGFTAQAVDFWQRAGTEALDRSANHEAVGHLNSAIGVSQPQGDEREWQMRKLQLLVLLGQAMIATRGYAARETVDTFEQAIQLADTIGDRHYRLRALFGQWAGEHMRGGDTRSLVAEFDAAANEGQESGPRVIALRLHTLENLYAAKFRSALEIVDESLAAYDPAKHRMLAREYGHDSRAVALIYKCWLKWILGYPDQSLAVSQEALRWANDLNHANTLGVVLCWGCVLRHALEGRVDETVKTARTTIAFAEERVMPLWVAWTRVFLGWAEAQSVAGDSGLAQIGEGLAQLDDLGTRRFVPWSRALHAEALSRLCRHDDALVTIELAFDSQRDTHDVLMEAELHRIRGDIRLRANAEDVDGARQEFRSAIDVARRAHAKSFELRATLRLARTLRTTGQQSEAQLLLRSCADWFTEGRGTPDLRQAASLLRELS